MTTTDNTTPDRPGEPGGSDESARVYDFPTASSVGPPVAPHPTPPTGDTVPTERRESGSGAGAGSAVVGPVVDGEVVTDDHDHDTEPDDAATDGEAGSRARRVDSPEAAEPGLLDRIRADKRRPVLPAWATSRAELAQTGRWVAAHYAHVAAYHALRCPKYATTLGLRAPVGATRAVRAALRWVFDGEGLAVRLAAVRREDAETYLRLSRQRDMRVRMRALAAVPAVLAVVIVAGVGWSATPGWVHALALVALVAVAGLYGAPADKRGVLDTAVTATKVSKLTSEIVTRALLSLGIAQINQTAKAGGGVTFPAPIVRDGPGWRAEVDLPFGVTATDVLERRDKLASGLRRPLGCVWPEPVDDEHAGRLVLWVGDEDMRKSRQPAWPLARSGRVDLFRPQPFGTDQRGRWAELTLMFTSGAIGAIPRMGKTFALRQLLLIAALDPRAELHAYDLKGMGDLSPLECVAHRYGVGEEDDEIAAGLANMRAVQAELRRRTKVVRDLPRDVCPENKVTPELASTKSLGLHPIVIGVDECQKWFEHPTHGAELEAICTDLVKRGPAAGLILLVATQRPDARSLPTGISANVSTRFCLKVLGQTENDMVLGTSRYKNGVRATTFGWADKGIGYLIGEGADAAIVRTVNIDAPGAERIAQRARAARQAAGTLSGHAIGAAPAADETTRDTVCEDVLAVVGDDEAKVWNERVIARLRELRPDVYASFAKAEDLTAALKRHGVKTGQVWGSTDDGRGASRTGITRTQVADVVAQRDRKEPGR